MSRPKLQYSNITYYAVQRQKIEFPPDLEELSEPLEILYEKKDKKNLTINSRSNNSNVSPQQGESNE